MGGAFTWCIITGIQPEITRAVGRTDAVADRALPNRTASAEGSAPQGRVITVTALGLLCAGVADSLCGRLADSHIRRRWATVMAVACSSTPRRL